MHGNIVTIDYKSEQDANTCIEQLSKLAEEFDGKPGFKGLNLLRTSPTQSIHWILFDNEKNLNAAREVMFPKLVEVAGPHIAGPPTNTPGPVVISRSA